MSGQPHPILQDAMPVGQAERAAARMPSMAPVQGPWLWCDEAYDAQMAERRRLIAARPQDVHAQLAEGLPAAMDFLERALSALPEGFRRVGEVVTCPDGSEVEIDRAEPLRCVGQMLQQDVCILEKRGDEHVLTGAILCFPASWTLAQKIGKPLVAIHRPVAEYDGQIAARVQRFFNGVQPDRPLWRANLLRYDDATLYQPQLEEAPRRPGATDAPYLRSERQTILRLDTPDAAAFVIHTTIVRA